MGYGRWESSGRPAYANTSALASKARHYKEVFTESNIVDALDPKKINIRESRDSEENPESNAIILALDVTGSMGSIAHQIAKDGLGKIIEGILEQLPVTDPHILFSAIGDVTCDSAPLQASQFEPDHRIIEQLNQIYVEGGGGGNRTESYDLPWYFAANMTSIDCFEKRGKKGYLFTFGDEMPPDGVAKRHIKRFIGRDAQGDATAKDLLNAASETYNVFHVIIEEGWFARQVGPKKVADAWRKFMGKRALPLDDYTRLPELVLAAMHVAEVIIGHEDKDVQATLRHAFGV